MKESIYTSTPVDKTASIVTSRTDHALASGYNGPAWRSRDKPPYIRYIGHPKHDHEGERYGKLVVIGLFIKQHKPSSSGWKKKSSWVVRCDCGYYEVRKIKTLKKGKVENNCCLDCAKMVDFTISDRDKDMKALRKNLASPIQERRDVAWKVWVRARDSFPKEVCEAFEREWQVFEVELINKVSPINVIASRLHRALDVVVSIDRQ